MKFIIVMSEKYCLHNLELHSIDLMESHHVLFVDYLSQEGQHMSFLT